MKKINIIVILFFGVILSGIKPRETAAQGIMLKPDFQRVKCGFFSPALFVNSEMYLNFYFWGGSKGSGLYAYPTGVNIGCRPKMTTRQKGAGAKQETRFTYNEFGLVKSAMGDHLSSKNTTYNYTYNKNRKLFQEIQACRNLKKGKFSISSYAYDAKGRLKSILQKTPEKCQDKSTKLSAVEINLFRYTGDSVLPFFEKLNYGSFKREYRYEYRLDVQKRIVYEKRIHGSGYETKTYQYESGRLVSSVHIIREETWVSRNTLTYKYDKQGRLKHLKIKGDNLVKEQKYEFDGAGNLSRLDLLSNGKITETYKLTY